MVTQSFFRTVNIQSKQDLININSYNIGMLVCVVGSSQKEDDGIYQLIDNDGSDINNWKRIGNSEVVTPFDFGAEIGADCTDALQAALDYIGENRIRLYIPKLPNDADFEISYALMPHKNWCYVYGDGGIVNVNPAYTGNTRGCVFTCGHITYPQLSRLEDVGENGVLYSVSDDDQTPKYSHKLSSISTGERTLTIEQDLYTKLSVGEIIHLRSDDLSVDKTGTTLITRNRRYGVYTYQSLFKIVEKWQDYDSKGLTSSYVKFEHPVDFDIDNPYLIRFPSTDEVFYNNGVTQSGFYSDTSPDAVTGISNRIPVGPIENFFLYGIRMGTSGNQAWSQANCVYNFNISNIRLRGTNGAVVGNNFCHGFMSNWSGTILGPVFAIAFGARNVIASNFDFTIVGPVDARNPNVSVTEGTYSAISHRNFGKGAISNSGEFDPDYLATVYARNNKESAFFYNYESNQWEYWKHDFEIFSDLDSFSGIPSTASIGASGFGDYNYIPTGSEVGSVGTVSVEAAINESRSMINIHENCRNIQFINSTITIENDYDVATQDVNLVGEGILLSGIRVISNRVGSLDTGNDGIGNGLAFGKFIEKGDLPGPSRNITVTDCYFRGSAVSNAVVIDECYNYPDENNTGINLSVNMVGLYRRLPINSATPSYYTLSVIDGITPSFAGLTELSVVRNDGDTSFLDRRYYAYYNNFRRKLMVYSPTGFSTYGKGWYIVPLVSDLTEPEVGGAVTQSQFDVNQLEHVVDENTDFSKVTYNWSDLAKIDTVDKIIYLGESVGYTYYGPFGYFSDSTTLDDVPKPNFIEFTPLSFFTYAHNFKLMNVTIDRAYTYGLSMRGGHYCTFKDIYINRLVNRNQSPASTRFLIDIVVKNTEWATRNTFENIQVLDDSLSGLREIIRDQGNSNDFRNIIDPYSNEWRNLYRRFFRQTSGGTLRSIFDYVVSLGVELNRINGRILPDSFTNLDRLTYGASSYRTGYGLNMNISGITKGSPTLYIRGGDPTTTASKNLLINTERFDEWTKGVGSTVTANTHINPINNIKNADTLTFSSSANSRIVQDITLQSNIEYTFSIWAKSDTAQEFRLSLGASDAIKATFSATFSWQRFSYSYTKTTATAITTVGIFNSLNAIAGDLIIWGAQIEEGATASEYVRNFDTNTISNLDLLQTIKLPYSSYFDLNMKLEILDRWDDTLEYVSVNGATVSPEGSWAVLSYDLRSNQSNVSRYYEKATDAPENGHPYVFICGEDDINSTDETGLGFWDGQEIRMAVLYSGSFSSVLPNVTPTLQSNSVRVDLLTSGGTRQLTFDVETNPDEYLDVYSYIVDPTFNI